MSISDSQIPTQHNIKAHFSHDKAKQTHHPVISLAIITILTKFFQFILVTKQYTCNTPVHIK